MLDSARAYLRAKKYPEHTIDGGLERLLAGWEAVANSVARGEVQYEDDYLNDMDGRRILEDMLDDLSPDQRSMAEKRLASADSLIRPLLIGIDECLWGAENAQKCGYSRDRDWWYFHRPPNVDSSWRSF